MPVLLLTAHLVLLAAVSPAAADEPYHYDPRSCQKSLRCGDGDGGVDVHYPFFLPNASRTINGTAYSYCGYPGMAVACDAGRATLLLGDDTYAVLNISYSDHTVTVAAADVLLRGGDCPRVTRNVTVPVETWLNLSTAANADGLAFFFGCVFTAATAPPPPIPPINCSGFPERDGVSYVLPKKDVLPQDQWPRACREAVVVPVLRDRLLSNMERLNGDGYGEVLRQGFQLTWDPTAGPCFLCENSKGQCSYNQSGQFIRCLCSDGSVRDQQCSKV